MDEARAAIARTLEMRRDISLALFRKSWRHLKPEYLELIIGDLAKAGLPAG